MILSTELDFEGHRLALEVEALPASEQQTKVSTLLWEYRQKVHRLEAERDAARLIARKRSELLQANGIIPE